MDDDYDGWSNEGDEFPDLHTQYVDSDNDGFGDNNSVGAVPDHWPLDPQRNVAEVDFVHSKYIPNRYI